MKKIGTEKILDNFYIEYQNENHIEGIKLLNKYRRKVKKKSFCL